MSADLDRERTATNRAAVIEFLAKELGCGIEVREVAQQGIYSTLRQGDSEGCTLASSYFGRRKEMRTPAGLRTFTYQDSDGTRDLVEDRLVGQITLTHAYPMHDQLSNVRAWSIDGPPAPASLGHIPAGTDYRSIEHAPSPRQSRTRTCRSRIGALPSSSTCSTREASASVRSCPVQRYRK